MCCYQAGNNSNRCPPCLLLLLVDVFLQTLMDKRVGPWINKKIVEYVGEEEPSLRDFICNKVYCGVTVLSPLTVK